jgi:putative DNA primase/helicase
MTIAVDEDMVREFITIISAHVVKLTQGLRNPGVLQLSRKNCRHGDPLVPHRFLPDDIEGMVKFAIGAAKAGHNVYIEPRTVRTDLNGPERGKLEDTAFVFATVIDADHDKGKSGTVTLRPSLTVATSPKNFHYWYLHDRLIAAHRGKTIGDAVRAGAGADSATGKPTQPYRLAGTPNYTDKAKQGRGRAPVEPTWLAEWSDRLWDPEEFLKAYNAPPAAPQGATATPQTPGDATGLPEDLMKAIREGGVSNGFGANGDKSGSGLFHHVVAELKKRKWTVEAIVSLMEKHPNGVAAKYNGRLLKEVERSYEKVEKGSGAGLFILPTPPGGGSTPPPPGAPPGATGAGASPQAAPYVLRTIQIVGGQMARAVAEAEQAMIAAGITAFSRAGALVYPHAEIVGAAGGRPTRAVQLSAFDKLSLIEPLTEAAIFQRYDARRRAWVDVDPPPALVGMLLARKRKWAFPHVAGVITTPTLRPDGSLLSTPGYDPRTELYLESDLRLPPIPQSPTRKEALAELAFLKELFAEFSFRREGVDLAIVLAGLLTALLRGSLPTAPVFLTDANAPGVGKSYLVDVISMVATGEACPVITISKNEEETEKRLGSVLLDGSPIVSLDNAIRDLEGSLLCQLTERPVVKVRILRYSEMPRCEVHTTVFATGNNVTFAGDMVRRGLIIHLEALSERPEFREFKGDAMKRAYDEAARYVAAALTIVRAYLGAGSPKVCGPFGSYGAWSAMVRSPLVWLGEPDPVDSMKEAREEDPEASNISEFFALWPIYMYMGAPYTTARIIEIANEQTASNLISPDLKQFLLKIAAMKGRESEISPDRLGWWLKRISGRIVGGLRLARGRDLHMKVANFQLRSA